MLSGAAIFPPGLSIMISIIISPPDRNCQLKKGGGAFLPRAAVLPLIFAGNGVRLRC
jgi:hypothetical protein